MSTCDVPWLSRRKMRMSRKEESKISDRNSPHMLVLQFSISASSTIHRDPSFLCGFDTTWLPRLM